LRAHDAHEQAAFIEEFADWIEKHLEDWTVTNDGVLLEGVKRHYMRVRPPETDGPYDGPGDGKERIHLNNRPPGTRDNFEAREIIDAGFLELVRYGVRRADDPLMADSLKVVDAVLKRDLPQGAGWLRYNWDGYGNCEDGGPFTGWGQGRVWPLLTGERAHYELAAGRDVSALIATYEKFATSGRMVPEQVWDAPDIPRRSLKRGGPAGSATPLVWAHAEYLKLLRSARDGQVFDRVEPVYRRYGTSTAPHPRRNIEIFTFRRPIRRIEAGETLRILDERRFEVSWSTDNWKTVHTMEATSMGDAGYFADIPSNGNGGGNPAQMVWTLRWEGTGTWLGYNVNVEIASPNPSA